MVQLRLPGWTDAPVRCHRRLRSGDVCVFLYDRWFNYGYQDGQTPPSGVTDGCDPATYVCFFMDDGSTTATRMDRRPRPVSPTVAIRRRMCVSLWTMVQLRLPGWTDAPVRCHRRLRSGDVCVFLY